MKYNQPKIPAIRSIDQCFRDSDVSIVSITPVFKGFVEIEAIYDTDRIDRKKEFKEIATTIYANMLSRKYFNKDLTDLEIYKE